MRARMISFYIVDLSMKTLRNVLFVDSIGSIVEKTAVMMRTATKIEEKLGLKRCYGTFLPFLI
jgi:glycyl-tRNA synthetase beta subunit